MRKVVAVSVDPFVARVEREGTIVHAWLEGDSGGAPGELGVLGVLELMLARIRAEAVRLELSLAIVDLRRLAPMSPACLRLCLAWLADLQALAERDRRRYRVMFLFPPALRWQRAGLDLLRCLPAGPAGIVTLGAAREVT